MGLLSWLRGERSGAPGAPAPDAAGAPAPTGPERPAEGGWRELPPVRRTVSDPALITDPDGFRGSLSSWQDTTLGTPLGHLVSPEAPSGLVHGLAVPGGPVAGPAPGRAPAPASVSRQAEGTREGVVASWSSPPSTGGATIVPRAVPLQRSGPAEAAMVSAEDPASGELPVRRLMGERPVEPSLPTSGPGPESPSALPSPSLPAAVRDTTPTPDAAPVQRSAAPEPATFPRPPKPAHTPGLGAPLSGLPPTAQRQAAARLPGPTADAPTGPLLGDVPPLVQREPERESAQESEPRSEQPSRHTSGSGVPLPPLLPLPPVPVRRSVSATALPEPASGPVVPLIAQRAVPLFATGPGAPLAPALPAGAEPQSVPVRWSSPEFRPEEPAVVQRSYAAGPPPRQAAATVVRPSPQPTAQAQARAPAALQRRVTGAPSGPPVPRSASGAFRDAGSVAVAAGVAQRLADGSVVFGNPSVIQRETGTTEPPPPDPPPEVESVPEPEPEPDPGPGGEFPDARTDPGAAATAGAGGGAGGNSPPVTDELVRALYAPLSRLLKADLRLERERAGFLINTRH
jgi:hypothetical protein